jgi:hypothetical protein
MCGCAKRARSLPARFYDRETLVAATASKAPRLSSSAIAEQMDATTLIAQRRHRLVDLYVNLLLP